jgi:RNA polymerase sigma-70 factor (ECF subfamily)
VQSRLSSEIPSVRILLRRLAGSSPALDPEDLLQETMQRAIRYQASYQPTQPLGAWLNGIALRVFLDARARTRREPLALGAADGEVEQSPPSAASVAAYELPRLLEHLPAAEREALERFHLRGESIADIARAMDAAEGTVKSWLHRARHRIAAKASAEDWL